MPSIDTHITKVEKDEATGWGRISTDDPNVKTLQTKRPDLLAEAGQLRLSGVLVRIEYTEREGNVNPNTGRPYLNRYYEKATALGEPPQATDSGVETVRQTRTPTDPDEAWRISLAAGGKLAVMTLPMMPTAQRSFEIQKRIALAWAEFFFFTSRPSRPSVNGNPTSPFQAPTDAGAEHHSPGAYDEPVMAGYTGPDDIPF